jgi:hypothetical protein
MKPTTLSEYYSSQGQSLPSVSARQGLASQAGIQGYTGTAQQNTQLLGFLSKNQGATPPTIPVNQALGNTQPAPLPNRPQQEEPTNVNTSAGAYLASLPKTGVAGLDQITQAMVERPGQLAQEYDIANKQSLAREAQFKYDKFNEEYRVKQERIRTEGGRTLEQINQEVNAIERTRAFTAGTLAIEAAYRSGDFQGAKELMNQQIALELEPMKMKYQFFKDMYDRTEDQKFQRAMKAEDRAYQTARENAKMLNEAKMSLMKSGATAEQITGIKSMDDYYRLAGQFTGTDPEIAMKIGESKVGQKVNSSIGFKTSLLEYQDLYKKYYESGELRTLKAYKDLATLRGDLEQKYSVANGQGAIQEGDRQSYKNILAGGIFFPERAISSMDILNESINKTINNDITFLDNTYGGQASQFFSNQLQDSQAIGLPESNATNILNQFTGGNVTPQANQAMSQLWQQMFNQ